MLRILFIFINFLVVVSLPPDKFLCWQPKFTSLFYSDTCSHHFKHYLFFWQIQARWAIILIIPLFGIYKIFKMLRYPEIVSIFNSALDMHKIIREGVWPPNCLEAIYCVRLICVAKLKFEQKVFVDKCLLLIICAELFLVEIVSCLLEHG